MKYLAVILLVIVATGATLIVTLAPEPRTVHFKAWYERITGDKARVCLDALGATLDTDTTKITRTTIYSKTLKVFALPVGGTMKIYTCTLRADGAVDIPASLGGVADSVLKKYER